MATAIVLAGAGARGAYEAGVLSVVLPKLLEDEREVVLVGTSAGAINAALLAGSAHLPVEAVVEKLRTTWTELGWKDVFELSVSPFVSYGWEFLRGGSTRARMYALLDTRPLKDMVDGNESVDWPQLRSNIGTSWVRALGIVATEVETTNSVVFVQGVSNLPPKRGTRGIEYRGATLEGPHVRASAAIPLAFPAVRIDGEGWFMDGGVRLNTPIAPGADLLRALGGSDHRVLVVSTYPDPDAPESSTPPATGEQPDVIAQSASMMHSMFVDRVAEDIHRLRRVNGTLRTLGVRTAGDPATGARRDVLRHAYFGPPTSGLLARAAQEAFTAEHRGPLTPFPFTLLSRLLGSVGPNRNELLSFFFFEPAYLTRAFGLGREHAEALARDGIRWSETADEAHARRP